MINSNTTSDTFDKTLFYPQKPTHQSFIIDYPILAYKSMAPDDSEIVIENLAVKMPQI